MFRGFEIWLLVIPIIFIVTYIYFNGLVVRDINVGKVSINGHEFDVEVANTILSRQKGLSGKEELKENEGMLFVFGSSQPRRFWMKDMLIPIDIIWINEGEVVGFEKNVQPEPEVSVGNLKTYSSPIPLGIVLEVRAGVVDELGIEVGDSVLVRL